MTLINVEFEKIPLHEQETIINRNRADENKVYIYSSDTRVMRKILNMSLTDASVERSGDKKKITGIKCTLEVKDFLRHVLMPLYKPKN